MSPSASITTSAPVLREIGRPMELEELEVAPPGPGEVRIAMTASGVCHSCLHAVDGSHGGVPLPIVLGDEGAGIVESVGAGVGTVRPGDHVVISWAPSCGHCRFCVSGRPVLCLNGAPLGALPDGTVRFFADGTPVHHFGPATYAPYTVVHESAAIPIDPRMPLDTAALIGCAVATGVGAVVNTGGARPGSSVAVFGCGGVGLNAVQGAALVGAVPITAVDIVPDRLALARSLGAGHTVDAAGDGALQELRDISGGGFDVTVVAIGSVQALEQAWAATGRGGTCVLVGKPPDGRRWDFDPQSLLSGERRLVGCTYGSSRPSVDFPKLAELYLAGRLKLDELVSRRYRIADANTAFDALAGGDLARGLIVF